MLVIHGHRHAIEYHREHGNGYREHAYTEVVDDQGFVLEHRPDRRQAWLTRYTRACAEDYLARVNADRGPWLVHVYRLLDTERRHVTSIRLTRRSQPGNSSTSGRVRRPR